MYQIKQKPEDFIVTEIMDLKTGSGNYAYYRLKKTDYNTVSALELLSRKFRIPLKRFGFAGNKDRHAVTEQHISILGGRKELENISLNGIELKHLGNGKEPISLGIHKGNEFIITIRNLGRGDAKKIKNFIGKNKKIIAPNYFGQQRFSMSNHIIGRNMVKGNFKKAAEIIAETSPLPVRQHLSEKPHDYIGAIKKIPFKTRTLFINSYQSFLFNKILLLFLKKGGNKGRNSFTDLKMPLIGFGFDIQEIKNKALKNIFGRIIEEENISPRDFIIRQMPELSSEGALRNAFFEAKDFEIPEEGMDELNEGMKKIKARFFLEKGCFATTLLDFIFNGCGNVPENPA